MRTTTNTKFNQPWIAVNMLMTADGKVSGPHRSSTQAGLRKDMDPMAAFGSHRDHRRLLRIRATMDAVICGRRTIESGPIDLGTGGKRYERMRVAAGLNDCHRKVVVSGSGVLNSDCKVFEMNDSPILIATTQSGKQRLGAQFANKPQVEVLSFGRETVHLQKLVAWLYEHWNIRRLVLEGGGKLNDAMFRAKLVDEIYLTVAPLVYGGHTHSTISDGKGFSKLSDAASFKCIEHRRVGSEMFLTYRKKS